MEIGQAKQQFKQTRAIFRGVWSIAREQLYSEITLVAEPTERARIRQLGLTAPFLNGRNAREDFVQVMVEAYTVAGERERDERRAGAHTASANLSNYDHTSPLKLRMQQSSG
jgi:hypothetical protein